MTRKGPVLFICLGVSVFFSCSQEKQYDLKSSTADSRSKVLRLACGNGVTMELVLIPAGQFIMGSASTEAKRHSDEGPQHRVRISKPFYMGKFEVTQQQYQAVMRKNLSDFKGSKNPVEQVSWHDAAAFCRKLSEKTGRTVRLPTEAQWEYACRAGSATTFHYGDRLSSDQANFDGNDTYGGVSKGVYRQKTVPVGSFQPNAFGLHDMHGNVWEWCADWHGEDYYANSPSTDPVGPSSGTGRILRGGSWCNHADYCRSATRVRYKPDDRIDHIGFRVVCVDSET